MSLLAVLLLVPTAAAAQEAGPPGPYVLDARIVLAGVPRDPSFFPPVPAGTLVPTRALGGDIGAHVYPFSIGPARLGIGASMFRAVGRATPPSAPSGSSSNAPQTQPDVDSTLTGVVPQLSFNFGSSTGWSYISAGIGRVGVRSTASSYTPGSGSEQMPVAAETRDLAPRQAINVGGGARWFTTARVAFGFDVRFHLVAARSTDEETTPRSTILVAGAGLSFR